jgi:hypothetical protein
MTYRAIWLAEIKHKATSRQRQWQMDLTLDLASSISH